MGSPRVDSCTERLAATAIFTTGRAMASGIWVPRTLMAQGPSQAQVQPKCVLRMRQAGRTGLVVPLGWSLHSVPTSRSAAPLRRHHHRAAAAARPSSSPSAAVSTPDPPHLTPGRTSRCLGFFGTAARSFKRAAVHRSTSSIKVRRVGATGVPATTLRAPAVLYEAWSPLLHAQRAPPIPAGTTGPELIGIAVAASHSVVAPIRRRRDRRRRRPLPRHRDPRRRDRRRRRPLPRRHHPLALRLSTRHRPTQRAACARIRAPTAVIMQRLMANATTAAPDLNGAFARSGWTAPTVARVAECSRRHPLPRRLRVRLRHHPLPRRLRVRLRHHPLPRRLRVRLRHHPDAAAPSSSPARSRSRTARRAHTFALRPPRRLRA